MSSMLCLLIFTYVDTHEEKCSIMQAYDNDLKNLNYPIIIFTKSESAKDIKLTICQRLANCKAANLAKLSLYTYS